VGKIATCLRMEMILERGIEVKGKEVFAKETSLCRQN
jgi:hypothetical protein